MGGGEGLCASARKTEEEVGENPIPVGRGAPEHIKADPAAYAAYQEASNILSDRSLSTSEKQAAIRIAQVKYGEELFTTVIRHVPVYDAESQALVSFDDYMRKLARQYQIISGSPLEVDPVGGAMRIFFDSSPETIILITGDSLTAEHRKAALERYMAKEEARSILRKRIEETGIRTRGE